MKDTINNLWVIIRWVPLVIALTILSYIVYQLWNMELTIRNVDITLSRPTPTATPTATPQPYATRGGSLKQYLKEHPMPE